MAWFALSLPTSGSARAALDPRLRTHVSMGRMTLTAPSALELTDLVEHKQPSTSLVPSPLADDFVPSAQAQTSAGPKDPDEPALPLTPLALREQSSDALAPLQPVAADAAADKAQLRKPSATPDRVIAPRRTRARESKARSAPSDRPPRLYKKLDF